MKELKLLVPLDFSDLSTKALIAAERLAELFGGTVTPFHSYLPLNELDGPYMLGLGATPSEDYEETESILTERMEEICKENMDEKFLAKPVISLGNPPQSIVDEAEEYDMIVMSTHGRTGFTRFFLGSVAEKVLRTSHVPVLVVDKESEIGPFKKILLTTDFSENSHAAFSYAKEIALAGDARIEMINVLSYDPQHEEHPDESTVSVREQRLKVLAKEELHEISDRLTTRLLISSNTPHEAILNYNLNNPFDLIIMSTIGRTGIGYLMMGSTTANVVRHVTAPVLSVNPKVKTSDFKE